MAAPGFRARIDVLLILPKDGLEDWSESDIANQARALPGVCVTVDQSGHEARLFGAATSGHVVVYDSAGRLVFQGGITPLRGHQGDCAGTAAVIAACRDEKPGVFGAPVYGCVLFDAPRVVEPQQPETCLCPDREGQP